MAFVLPDRTRETLASAPGTGNATTAGATQGAQSIASSLTSNGDTTWATIDNGTAWETNTITRVSAGVYSRGTPFASSNAGALVNFANGILEIFPDLPAIKAKILERLAWAAAAVTPPANDGTALGTGALSFSDLFLADGGVINWNNGDVLATQSTNALAFTGASSGYSFDALLNLSGAAAGQISFPATQNASAGANTLDDYEEGTWTPANANVTLTRNGTQSYTKVGRHATVTYDVTWPSTANAAAAEITAVPFTPQANGGGGVGYCETATFTSIFYGSGSAILGLYTVAGGQRTNAQMSTLRVATTTSFPTS